MPTVRLHVEIDIQYVDKDYDNGGIWSVTPDATEG